MGKVRKLRQKYHISLKKSKSLNNAAEVGDEQNNKLDSKRNSLIKSKENIFAGINISWEDLNKSLPEAFDARSVVSNKSRKELKEDEKHLKKKERMKLRHERFLQKLDVTHELIKNLKSKKKANLTKKKNLGTSMSSLLDALPLIESQEAESSKGKHDKPKTKSKGILKAKQRLKQQALDTKLFKHILDDKIFKENPLQAINQYLKQKVAIDT